MDVEDPHVCKCDALAFAGTNDGTAFFFKKSRSGETGYYGGRVGSLLRDACYQSRSALFAEPGDGETIRSQGVICRTRPFCASVMALRAEAGWFRS